MADGKPITVRALHERVVVLEPGIFRFSELKKPTQATLEVMARRVEALAAGLDAYGVIIDLSDSEGSTTSEYRRYIPRYFAEWAVRARGALRQVALPIDANPVVRVAAKFIVSRIADAPFVVYRSPHEAIAGVRAAIAKG